MTNPAAPHDFQPLRQPAPAICRRELGQQLRRLREARSLRLEDAGAVLGVAPSTLSRIETGQAPTRTSYLHTLLNLYGHTDEDQRKHLAHLAREGQRKEWWHDYADLLPPGTGPYLSLEAAASKICLYSLHAIPDLLQTDAYATAVIRASRPNLTKDQVSKLVAMTSRRQQIVSDHGRQLHMILDESVLHRQITNGADMKDQLSRLYAAGIKSNATIQIATLKRAWPALSCSFGILSFNGPADEVVSRQSIGGQIISNHSHSEIRASRTAFDDLAGRSMPAAKSLDLIQATKAKAPGNESDL